MSTYIENQQKLAVSPSGSIAALMEPGDKYLTPDRGVVTVWCGWRPDLQGDAEKYAQKYKLGFEPGHNTTLGITTDKGETLRVPVVECHTWTKI